MFYSIITYDIMYDNLLKLTSGASTSPGYDFHSPAVVESFMAAENDTDSDYIDEEFIVETGPLETDEYITNDEYFESDMLQAGNNTHVGGNQELVYYGLDPRMKCKNDKYFD